MDGDFTIEPVMDAVNHGNGVDLVVISQVMFMTGQIVKHLDALAQACHQRGTRLLVDSYHAVGVIPVDVVQLGADFVIGGSYKYLRGGPGACFLYIAPGVLEAGLRPARHRLVCQFRPLWISAARSARARRRWRWFSRVHSARAYLVPGPQRPGIHAGNGG